MSTLLTAAAVLSLAATCQHTYAPHYILDIAQGESLIQSGPNAGMFDPVAVNQNRDASGAVRSEDIGLMQINTQHLERFGLTRQALLEPCVSISVAEQILREFSSYNSGSPTGSLEYAKRAFLRMRKAASIQPMPTTEVPTPTITPDQTKIFARKAKIGRELVVER